MLIFLAGPDLGRDGATLDGVVQPEPAFALFAVGFFDTSAFNFMIAACEASEPGRGGECTTLPSAQELGSNDHHSGYSPF
jgi:hypothetical protein